MATYNNEITGGFTGISGPVAGEMWKGKNLMRAVAASCRSLYDYLT